MSEEEHKPICIVCKYTEDDYRVEISEGKVCDGCRDMNEKFQIYRLLLKEGVIDPETRHEWVDFTDETVEKYPVLKEKDIHGEWSLQQNIERQLDRVMNGRMRQYKIKTGKSLYGTTTRVFKRDDGKRKAPLISATCFKIGDMMPGCKRLGNRASYMVKERKDGTHFWSKASGNDKMWKRWVAKNYVDMELSFTISLAADEVVDEDAKEGLGALFG
jgi:hypothetical protein